MNIKIIRMIALSVLLAGLVMGCSSDDDPPTAVAGVGGSKPPVEGGGSKPPVEEEKPPVEEEKPPVEEGADSSKIQGEWLSPCYGNTAGGGIKLGLAFKGKAFGAAFSKYPDDSCSQKPEQDAFKGTFVFGEAVTTPSGLSANNLDLKIEDEGTIKALVGVNRNTMTINLGEGKGRPDDITDSKSTWVLEETGSGGGGGTSSSGKECDSCKSDNNCGSGMQCLAATDEDGNDAGGVCATPQTTSCPASGAGGKECDSCKSKSDCGSGMTCAKFESGLSRCVTPDTKSCPSGG